MRIGLASRPTRAIDGVGTFTPPDSQPCRLLLPPVAPSRGIETLESEAHTQREELKILDLTLRELTHRKSVLLATSLPDLSLSGEILYAQPNANILPPEEAFLGSGTAGVVLSWSPNELAEADASREALEADMARVREQRHRTWREIRFAIRSQLNALKISLRRLEATRERVSATAEAHRTRQVAFDNGLGLFSELLSAEADLNRARQSFLFALVDAHLARARLRRALGRPLNDRG